ncbi:MAG: hypothetical protein ACE366_26225 [Bradymonadia bacterium]
MSIPLGPWSLSPRYFVRTSGVPFERIELTDEHVDAISEALGRLDASHAHIEATASAAHLWLDDAPDVPTNTRRRLRRHIARRVPLPEGLSALDACLEAYTDALHRHARSTQALTTSYDALRLTAREQLWAAWNTEQVSDAITLLSPKAAAWLGKGNFTSEEGARQRKLERRLYLYLQRLCTKAETTSSFGPIASGQVEHGATGVHMRHGPRLITQGRAYPSGWLVRAVAAQGAVRFGDALPVRPALDVVTCPDGTYRYVDVSPFERRWLPDDGLRSRTPATPRQHADGLSALAESWSHIDHPEIRTFVGDVEALAAQIRAFPLTSGAARREALAAIATQAEALTGEPGYRGAGEMYADRMPFFEDCTRDVERFVIGHDIVQAMAPLGAALDLWLGAGVSQRLHLADIHHTWRAHCFPEALQGEPVDMGVFLQRYHQALQAETLEDAIFASQHRLNLTPPMPRALLDAIDASPDAVCPVDLEALPGDRGQEPAVASFDVHLLPPCDGHGWQVVLGEGHAMVCAFQFFLDGLPDEAEFYAELDDIYRAVTDDEVLLKTYDTFDAKLSYRYLSPALVDFDPGAEGPPDRPKIGWADLKLHFEEGGWHLSTPDPRADHQRRRGRFLLKAPRELGPEHALPGVALQGKGLPRPGVESSPRVVDGDLVLFRRTWRLAPEQLMRCNAPTRAATFARVHRLRCSLEIPRFFFVKAPDEPKPIWIDALNPVAIDLLISLARHSDRPLICSEMLPDPSQLWFRDDRGRYVCELRANLYRRQVNHR